MVVPSDVNESRDNDQATGDDSSTQRGSVRAAVCLPSRDLAADLQFFSSRLGFRLDEIFPADDPEVATMSGHGLRIRLVRSVTETPGTLRLACDEPLAFADGDTELIAPGGTRVEIRDTSLASPALTIAAAARDLIVQRLGADDAWNIGRASMHYRDLIPDRLDGAIIASHIRIPDGGPVPDMVHFHDVQFQLIFCYRGWVRVVYEDQGPAFVLTAGDCVTQPPGIRHRVLEASEALEVIEIAVPARHLTTIDHDLLLPTEEVRTGRNFAGQRFCHHTADTAAWRTWRLAGFQARDTGIRDATAGIAGAHVARRTADAAVEITSHDADILFTFVLAGRMSLRAQGRTSQALSAGDAFVIPAGMRTGYSDCSADLELLEVSLPGEFQTSKHQTLS